MSRTPTEPEAEGGEDYLEAFRAVFRLHERGMSFSGREPNCIYLNTGRGRFADVSAASGLDFIDDGRAVAATDWDHDGDLDLWLANRTGPRLRFLRNELPPGARSLTLELEGRTVNRDAIGARVEARLGGLPKEAGRTLWATLHAGEGFLAQSSKRLHLGLGSASTIEGLAVHWPGGEREEFTGAAPGGRYRLVEGTGVAEALPSPPPPPLEASPLDPIPEATPARVFFAGRAPLPELRYRTFEGEEAVLEERPSGPTLVNLWASWCLPCDAELRALEERRPELERAGLRVLLLSVDGLDEAQATGPDDARRFLERRGIGLESGLASPELLAKLEVLTDRLFSRRLPAAVPTSLLIDRAGRLAALYRGPVEPEQVLADARRLEVSAFERRALASPFPGRWFAPPQELRLTSLARSFLEEGYADEAVRYLERSLALDGDDAALYASLADLTAREGRLDEARRHALRAAELDPGNPRLALRAGAVLEAGGELDAAARLYRQAVELEPQAAEARFRLGNALGALGVTDEAEAAYREALALEPGFAEARNNLGVLLLAGGEPAGAEVEFRAAAALRPDYADAELNLGMALARQGRTREALRHYRELVERVPESAEAHNNLGVLLLAEGRLAEAEFHFRRALDLRPDFPDARDNLETATSRTPDP